jgi:hypothetical protein
MFRLSVNGHLKSQAFNDVSRLADHVGLEYGGNLKLNKVGISCQNCRELDKKALSSNADKSRIICYELMTPNYAAFGANKPQSISYTGSMIHCNNCNKETIFNSF